MLSVSDSFELLSGETKKVDLQTKNKPDNSCWCECGYAYFNYNYICGIEYPPIIYYHNNYNDCCIYQEDYYHFYQKTTNYYPDINFPIEKYNYY